MIVLTPDSKLWNVFVARLGDALSFPPTRPDGAATATAVRRFINTQFASWSGWAISISRRASNSSRRTVGAAIARS
jgi:hypothetical protein